MAEETKRQPWYQTVSGILTALGAFAVGVGTLLSGYYQYRRPSLPSSANAMPVSGSNVGSSGGSSSAQQASESDTIIWSEPIYVERWETDEIAKSMKEWLDQSGLTTTPNAIEEKYIDIVVQIVSTPIPDQSNVTGSPEYYAYLKVKAVDEPDGKLILSTDVQNQENKPTEQLAEAYALCRAIEKIAQPLGKTARCGGYEN
jgi:hypothetical protein